MKTTTFDCQFIGMFINITVRCKSNSGAPQLHNQHIRISSVVLVYQSAFDNKLNDYNLIRVGMVTVHSDKTGILSQTSIIGIKCEAILCFKLTE